jgi:hypothetical protein
LTLWPRLPIIRHVSSVDEPAGLERAQQILLRVAEQVGLCSRALAQLAQEVAALRQRLHAIEQSQSREE